VAVGGDEPMEADGSGDSHIPAKGKKTLVFVALRMLIKIVR
jgi:hypothetical protein